MVGACGWLVVSAAGFEARTATSPAGAGLELQPDSKTVTPNSESSANLEDFRITDSPESISYYQPNHDHNLLQSHIAEPRNNT